MPTEGILVHTYELAIGTQRKLRHVVRNLVWSGDCVIKMVTCVLGTLRPSASLPLSRPLEQIREYK